MNGCGALHSSKGYHFYKSACSYDHIRGRDRTLRSYCGHSSYQRIRNMIVQGAMKRTKLLTLHLNRLIILLHAGTRHAAKSEPISVRGLVKVMCSQLAHLRTHVL